MPFETDFYPESRFGGFTDIDGTVIFYTRVNSLLDENAVVIDYGCGRGAYGEDPVKARRALRILKGKAKRVMGLDVSEQGSQNPYLDEFHQISPSKAPWPISDNEADLCICDSVLEHMENPEYFFNEASRTLKAGGHLCIRTPNRWSYIGIASRLLPNRYHAKVAAKVQEGRKEEDVFPTLYRCNSMGALKKMLKKKGFEGVVYGYEAEPQYMAFSKAAYFLGTLHQKYAPSCLKLALFAFAKKITGDGQNGG
ncbi:MAG: methyltransferase domain-containing protein [Candidatus Eremiobacteraeota bacterium]|nr:methyltransferase domain-containing protein [Candidatus Eremiobacteraeota bacterium]